MHMNIFWVSVHACLLECMHISKTCTLLSDFSQYSGTHYGTGGKGPDVNRVCSYDVWYVAADFLILKRHEILTVDTAVISQLWANEL
jgi:hypothetical protein